MSQGKNRWLDDDDDDVEEFDPNRDYFTQVVEKKENNMLDSTMRSLRMIDESERVGIATGEELVRQGEVLRRSEKKVDKMEQDLKESDRHLRSIKSLWGAFRNKFSKEPPPPTLAVDEPEPAMPNSRFAEASRNLSAADAQSSSRPPYSDSGDGQSLGQRQDRSGRSQGQSSTMNTVEDNLDLMGNGLAKLKQLGLGLQEEIDAQDPILSRLTGKMERVDAKMNSTNKEMLKIYHS